MMNNVLKAPIHWCTILDCDDPFHLVNNIQQQETASLFHDMDHAVSTSVKELDNDDTRLFSILKKPY